MTAEQTAQQVQVDLADTWLPNIYCERVRKLRTRSYQFERQSKKPGVQIQHTLLGVELKIGARRLLCPDLATARYLSIFARIGCERIAVPYDITRISQLADQLESSWHRMLLLTAHYAGGKSEAFASRVRKQLVERIRAELTDAGAGPEMPEFIQTTSQRS